MKERIDEVYRPMNEKLFNNLEKQYQELAKVKAESEQIEKQAIEEMRKDLIEIFDEEYEKCRLITPQNTAEKMTAKGYRKQIEGEWEKVMNHKECSNCHYRAPYKKIKAGYHLQDLTAYCPNCGAKMRGV